MGEAELKVVLVIVRQTFGWHRDKTPLSLTFLQGATGLSRQAVKNGLDAAMNRGIVGRVPHKNSFAYFLVVSAGAEHPDSETVNEVDQSAKQSTKKTKNSLPSRPKMVHEVDPNKEKKESKENYIAPQAAQREMVSAISLVSGLDVVTNAGLLGRAASTLRRAGRAPADVIQFGDIYPARVRREGWSQPPPRPSPSIIVKYIAWIDETEENRETPLEGFWATDPYEEPDAEMLAARSERLRLKRAEIFGPKQAQRARA